MLCVFFFLLFCFFNLICIFSCRYGCEHEEEARQAFIQKRINNRHINFSCVNAGLHISAEYPFIAATPDGLLDCECCGEGLLEVKCPFRYCNSDLPDAETGDSEDLAKFYMEVDFAGGLSLKRNHQYYYQVQAQMNICDRPYCDFVVWSSKGMIVQRIYRDKVFFEAQVNKVMHFIQYGVLPELVGKWLTRKVVANKNGVVVSEEQLINATIAAEAEAEEAPEAGRLICYCSMPATSEMLRCANLNCTIKEFHMDCLRVRCPPRGNWFCPHCRLMPKSKRKTVKGKK